MKYQSSNKHFLLKRYFILNSTNFVMVLTAINKHFFVCYHDQFGNPRHSFVWAVEEHSFRNSISNTQKTQTFINKPIFKSQNIGNK